MSLILLLFVPAIFLIVRPISKRIGPLHETSDKYIDIQNDVMRERLHGIRVIRAFNKEASLQQKIADATHVMAENIINANVQMGLLSPAAVLLVNLAGVAILWLGGWRMETGSHAISGGDIFAIIQYLALVANGVLMGGFAIVMLPHARVAAGRIGEIFQATGMQETAKGAEHTFGGEIAFDHVTFRYEGASEAAVQDVSMHILPGQKIAVIGGTGSGCCPSACRPRGRSSSTAYRRPGSTAASSAKTSAASCRRPPSIPVPSGTTSRWAAPARKKRTSSKPPTLRSSRPS